MTALNVYLEEVHSDQCNEDVHICQKKGCKEFATYFLYTVC